MKYWMNLLAGLLVVGLIACGGDSNGGKNSPTGSTEAETMSPEDAHRELGALGIQFDQGSLEEAIINNDSLAVALFYAAGMDPQTIFIWALELDRERDKALQALLVGERAIDAELMKSLTEEYENLDADPVEKVNQFLKNGADATVKAKDGCITLMVAISFAYDVANRARNADDYIKALVHRGVSNSP